MLNDTKIKEIIQKDVSEGEIEGFYFYAVVTASFGKIVLLGGLAPLLNKFYLVNITNRNVHIYGLDMLGGPNSHSQIPMSEIKSIKVSNWWLGLGKKIEIESAQGAKIKLKANKFTLGIKQQKGNLAELAKHFSTGVYL